MEDKVIIYTINSCIWCKIAKKFLKKNKISFEERVVTSESRYREELILKAKKMVVPVIEAGNEIIIGFDRVKLEKILAISEK